jgi:DNA-binding IclR family transcriptional regulator
MKEHNSQERMLEIILRLTEHHVTGMSNKELAAALGVSDPAICRDLGIFQKYRWIERGVTGKWRMSPEFGGMAGTIMRSYREAKLLLGKDEARYASVMQ